MTGHDDSFGQLIRNRRRQLDLSQQELARRLKISTAYFCLIEGNRRHPSQRCVVKIANELGLDPRDLFLLANPGTKSLVAPETGSPSAWEAFAKDESLRRIHNITDQEMETLSTLALLGEVRFACDFVYILNAIRHALGKQP